MSWGCVRLCLCCNFGQVSSQVLVALLLNSLLHQLRVPIMSKNKKRKRIARLAFFVLQPWRPGFFNTWQFWNTVLACMQILLNFWWGKNKLSTTEYKFQQIFLNIMKFLCSNEKRAILATSTILCRGNFEDLANSILIFNSICSTLLPSEMLNSFFKYFAKYCED